MKVVQQQLNYRHDAGTKAIMSEKPKHTEKV